MNEQTPFGFFPGNPNNFPNQQCNCTREVRNLTNRVNNLERQMNRLERRVRRLENFNVPTPYAMGTNQNDYPSAYDNDNYII